MEKSGYKQLESGDKRSVADVHRGVLDMSK